MQNDDHKRMKKPVGALDGMLAGGAPRPRRPQQTIHRPQLGQPAPGRQLDNFKVKEGFHSSRQPQLSTPNAPNAAADQQPATTQTTPGLDLSLDEGAKKPKKNLWQRFWTWPKRKYMAIPAVLILIFGFLVIKGILNWNQIFRGGGGAAALQEGVDPSQLRGEGDGRVNILLLGKGGPGHEAPDLTDTLLVASIDPINNKAALLSIPRDLWVQPEGYGYTKINAVYVNAKNSALYNGKSGDEAEGEGLAAIEKVVSDKMGIPVHYHALVDFNAFKEAINTVGGVDINVGENNTVYEVLWDESTGQHYTLNVQTGQQHFDGQRALFYARSRQTSTRGDFDRTERQRLILIALKEKVLSLGTFANPAKVAGLSESFGNNVRINMTTGELLRLYEIAQKIDNNSVESIGLADPPNDYVTTSGINGLSVVIPKAGIDDYSEIQNYVRNKLRDGFLANEDAKILILNGTTIEGLANKTAKELKSFGYNVIGTGTAPSQGYAQTTIVDLRGGQKKYTKYYLEKRFGLAAADSLPEQAIDSGEADFVIILGTNEATR